MLAIWIARVMKVERGRFMCNIRCIRRCTSSTDSKEIVTAILESGSASEIEAFDEVAVAEDVGMSLGGAVLTLLRLRLPNLEMRLDWSEGYDFEIVPRYARTSPFSRRPLGPLAGILSVSDGGTPFSCRS